MQYLDIQELKYLPIKETIKEMADLSKSGEKPKTARRGAIWIIKDEISPVDLSCYLNARFGPANGFQMLLKSNDSDNLIHWHYSLNYKEEKVEIQCFSFRLEIMHSIEVDDQLAVKTRFISDIKKDFSTYGKQISEYKKKLEKWRLFVNPFFRIKSVIEHQLNKLDLLKINEIEPFVQPTSAEEAASIEQQISCIGEAYTEATALGLNIRMLAPVYAESFINLLIFLLAEDDIKSDKRMYESTLRQQIDIRIKGLHRHCKGFYQPVDYNNVDACKKFHTLINHRNDLLHGNIDPLKLDYETVYFEGNMPLFENFRNFGFYAWEASIRNVTPDLAIGDYQVVQDLISYVLVCLEDDTRNIVLRFMETKDPGWNEKGKRAGVLFPGHMVDMFPQFGKS